MSLNAHRLLLDEVDHHFRLANEAREKTNAEKAAAHLERSAASLLRLAKITRNPALKRQRHDQASRMQAIARLALKKGMGNDRQDVSGPVSPVSATPVNPAGRVPEPAVEAADNGTFGAVARPNTRFHHVVGLADAKREIRLRMIDPYLHPDLAARWKMRKGGGILLYGPPGTGKTLLARATAGELNVPFFAIKAGDIMSKWVGEAEQRVSSLFTEARRHDKAVIFIDELEALVPARSRNGSTVMARVVPQLLAEMDGFEKSSRALLFIGATNEPWSLDPAVLRPPRLDVHILVDLPDALARFELLKRGLDDMPLGPDIDLSQLADQADGLSGADIDGYCNRVAQAGFEGQLAGETEPMGQADLQQILQRTRPTVSHKTRTRFQGFEL